MCSIPPPPLPPPAEPLPTAPPRLRPRVRVRGDANRRRRTLVVPPTLRAPLPPAALRSAAVIRRREDEKPADKSPGEPPVPFRPVANRPEPVCCFDDFAPAAATVLAAPERGAGVRPAVGVKDDDDAGGDAAHITASTSSRTFWIGTGVWNVDKSVRGEKSGSLEIQI